MPTVFNHVGLSVSDIEREAAFYRDAFGLTEEFRFRIEDDALDAIVLRSEDGWGVELLSRPDSAPRSRYSSPNANVATQGFGHLCLRVDDIHTVHARLLELGATTISAPGPGPHPAVTFSYVADPEGHFVELLQVADGATL